MISKGLRKGLALALGFCFACSPGAPPPPDTRKLDVVDTLHGVEITDPYRWLEDQDSAETRAWIDAQTAYTETIVGESAERLRFRARLEELLRYDGPVHVTGRIALDDIEVGGHRFEAGEQVVTHVAAANRDPARFDGPNQVDIRRPDNHHLTFSGGIHYCLGAALARLEGQIAIGSIAQRFPDLELVTTEPEYREHFVLRGLRELQLSTGA